MNKSFTSKKSLHHVYRNLLKLHRRQSFVYSLTKEKNSVKRHSEIRLATHMPENKLAGPSDEVINTIFSYSQALANVDIAEPEFRLTVRN